MTNRIPIGRIIEKLDEHLSRNDKQSAERHLLYWFDEAQSTGDKEGLLSLSNELMGFYRKSGERDNALKYSSKALSLISELNLSSSVTAGSTYVNAATVNKAFGMPSEAIILYRQAQEIYEKSLKDNDGRLGGLYNNMALALSDLKKFDEAIEYYGKAISVMKNVDRGELEVAITHLNMADTEEAMLGPEKAESGIAEHIEAAYSLLNLYKDSSDGYYAFVCEKCAPSFGYYGYFLYETELKERAKKIYERA